MLRTVVFHFPDIGASPRLRVRDAIQIPNGQASSQALDYIDRYLPYSARESLLTERAGVPPAGNLEPFRDEIIFSIKDHPYRLVTNNAGLRNKRNISYENAADLYRIYCLGDSFTYGPYLANEETYPSILQNLLNDDVEAGRFEVLNGGVEGYYIKQQYKLFTQRGHRVNPDLVILQVLDNDVPGYRRDNFQTPPASVPTAQRDSMLQRLSLALKQSVPHFAIMRVIYEFKLVMASGLSLETEEQDRALQDREKHDLKRPIEGRDPGTGQIWTNPNFRDRLQTYKDQYEFNFKLLVEFLEQSATALVVVYIPTQQSIRWVEKNGHDPAANYYARLSRRYNIRFVNLTPNFRNIDERKFLYLWPWNGHLSFRGNHVVAMSLKPLVEQIAGSRAAFEVH